VAGRCSENSLPVDQNGEAKRESSSTKHPELPDIETENLKLKADLQLALSQLEAVQRLQAENLKLKEDLELALSQLEAIRCEVEKPVITDPAEQVIPGNDDDVWTLISDVHKKYQVPLVSAIADQVHDSKVAKLLSDVAEQLITKSGPKRAFDAMFGDNGPLYFQSLRVPDWTLLDFKSQARIPDQGWQTLLSLTKLGRTGSNTDVPILLNKNQMKAIRKMIFWNNQEGNGHQTPFRWCSTWLPG